MKFALETADAWLDALASSWKRVLLFLGAIIAFSLFGAQFGEYPGIAPVLQYGGVTFLLAGPLLFWALFASVFMWIQFVLYGDSSAATFLLMGFYISLNAAFFDRDLEIWQFILLQIVALLALLGRIVILYKVEKI